MTNEQKKDWFLRLDPNGTASSQVATSLGVLSTQLEAPR